MLLQHNHAGGNAHLVIAVTKNVGGDVIGSVYVAPHRPLVIDKEKTDTLYNNLKS